MSATQAIECIKASAHGAAISVFCWSGKSYGTATRRACFDGMPIGAINFIRQVSGMFDHVDYIWRA